MSDSRRVLVEAVSEVLLTAPCSIENQPNDFDRGYASGWNAALEHCKEPLEKWIRVVLQDSKEKETQTMSTKAHATIVGRLTADPEIKTTQNGIEFVSFTVAVDGIPRQNQEAKSSFYRCTTWRQNAKFLGQYGRKGSEVVLIGPMEIREYIDQNNVSRTSVEVTAEYLHLPKTDSQNQGQNQGGYQQPQGGHQQPQGNQQQGAPNGGYQQPQGGYQQPQGNYQQPQGQGYQQQQPAPQAQHQPPAGQPQPQPQPQPQNYQQPQSAPTPQQHYQPPAGQQQPPAQQRQQQAPPPAQRPPVQSAYPGEDEDVFADAY